MSDSVVGIVGATVGIGQYIINDYVITLAPVEGDYGYTMTITRGSDTQTVTLYGLSTEQYNSMLGYLQQAQEAAQSAEGSASDAYAYLELALDAANRANSKAASAEQSSNTARGYASQAEIAKVSAETAKTDAQTARTQALSYKQSAEAAANRAASAATRAGNAQTAAETAQTAAETAETNAQTYAGQAFQSATNAGQSAASAAQTLTQVQNEGASQIAAIDAEGQRVIDSIPEDYSQMEADVTDLKSQMDYKASLENKIYLKWTVGKYIKASNGDVATSSGNTSATLDYIPVKQGDVLSIYVHAPGASDGIALYNTSKQFVDSFTLKKANAPLQYTVPSDGYMRFSNGNNAANILNADAYVQLVNAEYPSMEDVARHLNVIDNEINDIVPDFDPTATYRLGEYSKQSGQVYKAFAPIGTGSWNSKVWADGDPSKDICDNWHMIDAISKSLEMPLPQTYASTIVERNVSATLATNLKFERNTQYKFTFKIPEAINTEVYFTLRRDASTSLFTKTIATGNTNVEYTYTTSESYDITEGQIRASGNIENLAVQVVIEPVNAAPTKIEKIIKKPLTMLPNYIVKNLAYKPLGNLEKGYICLVTDDGNAAVNTYTIPMVLAKGVPCTFSLMSASDVMQSQSDIDIVLNAIANGGCSVAQHGGTYWTNYTEDALNDFFDTEKAFFDSVGITIEGAVLPGNYTNDIVQALAGGRFGIVRQGHSDNQGTLIYYDNYTAGARSNLYNMPAYNVIDKTLQGNKNAIDYAIANKKLLTIYWHENELTSSSKEMLEAVIDYAKTTSIEFVTLGDVRKIL